jgi:hypothetical protein
MGLQITNILKIYPAIQIFLKLGNNILHIPDVFYFQRFQNLGGFWKLYFHDSLKFLKIL